MNIASLEIWNILCKCPSLYVYRDKKGWDGFSMRLICNFR